MNLGDITNLVIAVTLTVAILIAVYTFWKQNNQAKQFLGIQILRRGTNELGNFTRSIDK